MIDYTTMSGRNAFVNEAFLRRKFEDRLVDIFPLLSDGNRVLEVGCAEGSLCKYLKEKRSIHFTGIEPSLDRNIASMYIDEVHSDMDLLTGSPGYDLIMSFHTLEHIKNPLSELKNWGRLLRKNGHLILEVPNGPGHPDILSDTNSEHLSFFKPSTLSTIVESAGFEVLRLTGRHFESPLYPDSLRIVATPNRGPEERLGKLLERFQSVAPPVGIFGIGGDFFKFIAPILDDFMPIVLLDSNTKPRKYKEAFITPQVYSYPTHKDINILISTFRFEEEVFRELLDLGHSEKRLFPLSRILLD